MKWAVVLTVIILTCKASTSFSQQSDYVHPEIPNDCMDGHCISGQWFNDKYYYSIVAIDDTELKANYSSNSRTLQHLRLFDKVTVLYLYNKRALVTTHFSGNVTGWIDKEKIAFKSDFVPPRKWDLKKIDYELGDVIYHITFIKSNNFFAHWVNSYPSAIIKKGIISGYLYQYKDIIALYSGKLTLFIYIDKNKKEYSYFNGKVKIIQ